MRSVHFTDRATGACTAAIVTATDPDPDDVPSPGQVFASLAVFGESTLGFERLVLQDEDEHRPGTWHWPERVEDDA